MIHDFSLDLKVARRKAGLTQVDCAHLLGVDPTRISKLEAGRSAPTVIELSILHFVFDLPADTACRQVIKNLSAELDERLATLPACPNNWRGRLNRLNTLNALARRLEDLNPTDHGGG